MPSASYWLKTKCFSWALILPEGSGSGDPRDVNSFSGGIGYLHKEFLQRSVCLASGHETEHAQKAHLDKEPDLIAAA